MPIFVFKIQLVCSKWVLSVGLFYLSRLFERVFFLRLIKDEIFINFVLFQRFNAFWQSLKFLKQLLNNVRIS